MDMPMESEVTSEATHRLASNRRSSFPYRQDSHWGTCTAILTRKDCQTQPWPPTGTVVI